MPEGDAIHRDASRLRPLLEGQEVLTIQCRWPAVVQGLQGATLSTISTHGKQLLLHFDAGVVIRVHRGMTGFWRRGARLADADLRLGLQSAQGFVGLYNAPVVERIDSRALATHPVLSTLGPDLLSPTFSPEEAARRCPPEVLAGVALLDQTIAAGIGNIYRAETLFYERTSPFLPIGALANPERLWARAQALMTQNLGPGRGSRTREGPFEHWVYLRHKRPCGRCGRPVMAQKLGGQGRSAEQLIRTVYWCPQCQPTP